MDPTDVFGSGQSPFPNATYGGSPHLRGIEFANWTTPADAAGPKSSLSLSSLDVPIACLGTPSPFPTPRTAAPDMDQGVAFNIQNQIWNTNYILW